jgi:hypothetical protein
MLQVPQLPPSVDVPAKAHDEQLGVDVPTLCAESEDINPDLDALTVAVDEAPLESPAAVIVDTEREIVPGVTVTVYVFSAS